NIESGSHMSHQQNPSAARRRGALAAAVLVLAGPLAAAGAPSAQARTAPVANPVQAGPGGSAFVQGLGTEQWTTTTIAPGVRVSTVTMKNAGVTPFWTVTVEQPVTSKITGAPANAEVESHTWAQTTAAQLQAQGLQ